MTRATVSDPRPPPSRRNDATFADAMPAGRQPLQVVLHHATDRALLAEGRGHRKGAPRVGARRVATRAEAKGAREWADRPFGLMISWMRRVSFALPARPRAVGRDIGVSNPASGSEPSKSSPDWQTHASATLPEAPVLALSAANLRRREDCRHIPRGIGARSRSALKADPFPIGTMRNSGRHPSASC